MSKADGWRGKMHRIGFVPWIYPSLVTKISINIFTMSSLSEARVIFAFICLFKNLFGMRHKRVHCICIYVCRPAIPLTSPAFHSQVTGSSSSSSSSGPRLVSFTDAISNLLTHVARNPKDGSFLKGEQKECQALNQVLSKWYAFLAALFPSKWCVWYTYRG